jgi:RNA polymerase sigma-70 factor (ECF subfamily)
LPNVSELRTRSGDGYRLEAPGGFSRLFEAHSHDVLRFLARRCFDTEVAVDLTAETFAQAFASRRRFRGRSEAEAEAWLYAIARRQLGKYLRRGYAEQRALKRLGIDVPALTEEDYRRVEELAGVERVRAALQAHLNELSGEQREALQLRVVEERSYQEIARQLRVSEQVVRARVSRALRQLAAAMDAAASSEGFEHA